MKRRSFLQTLALVGAVSALGRPSSGPRVLILGGTRFLGRAFAEEVLLRGFPLSLFHRGQTGLDLYPEAEHILGDRNGDLRALQGLDFDLVIDTSGQRPRQVHATAALFPKAHYLFISTISVYADHSQLLRTESSPLLGPGDSNLDEESPRNYGERKVACEAEAGRHASSLILRPGLIVGPHDPTDRFTYWVMRGAGLGGSWGPQILAPGNPDDPIQWIDARDLACWGLDLALQKTTGIVNAVGPARRTGIGKLLQACAPGRETVWVPAPFLETQGVLPWKDLPAWVPPHSDSAGFTQISNRKALGLGLALRPVEETVSDILAWRRQQPQPLATGLTPQKEREVLALFKKPSP